MAGKRKSRGSAEEAPPDESELGLVAQKQRTDGGAATVGSEVVIGNKRDANQSLQAFKPGAQRTSSLDAPIMLLEGHEDSVNGVKFSPDGGVVASCGSDKLLHLWNVRGECEVRTPTIRSIARAPPPLPRKPYFLSCLSPPWQHRLAEEKEIKKHARVFSRCL